MRNDAPVMVTALGGSGTRMVAAVLAAHGLYLGDCLNPPLDNSWLHFLLFNRDPFGPPEDFRPLIELFARRMRSPENWDDDAMRAVLRQREWLEKEGVELGNYQNLARGYETLLIKPDKAVLNQQEPWGFKYPPGYLYAPSLFDIFPSARMVFLIRHPLDMAYSSNLNQLRRFGHWLGSEVEVTPCWQLKFWLKAYDYVNLLSKRYAIRCVGFEALISRPVETFAGLFDFLGLKLDPSTLKIVRPQQSTGRYRTHSLSDFDQEDLKRVKDLGFSISAK